MHWKQELSKPAPFTDPYRVTEAGALLFSLPSLPRSLLIDALPEPVTNGALFILKRSVSHQKLLGSYQESSVCWGSLCTVFTLQYKQPPDDCCYELVLKKNITGPASFPTFHCILLGTKHTPVTVNVSVKERKKTKSLIRETACD